jgi:hypothetical protein
MPDPGQKFRIRLDLDLRGTYGFPVHKLLITSEVNIFSPI